MAFTIPCRCPSMIGGQPALLDPIAPRTRFSLCICVCHGKNAVRPGAEEVWQPRDLRRRDGATETVAINDDVLELIAAGSGHLLEGKCAEADDAQRGEDRPANDCLAALGHPQVYLYRADPASDHDGNAKHRAELCSFAAAILPLINECSWPTPSGLTLTSTANTPRYPSASSP
ncbi:unnamed protein product [Ectocarpus sp. 12 AP-2014]